MTKPETGCGSDKGYPINSESKAVASGGGSAARMAFKSDSVKSSMLKTCRSRPFNLWYSSTDKTTTRSRHTGSVNATS